jgi:hypothetical protein
MGRKVRDLLTSLLSEAEDIHTNLVWILEEIREVTQTSKEVDKVLDPPPVELEGPGLREAARAVIAESEVYARNVTTDQDGRVYRQLAITEDALDALRAALAREEEPNWDALAQMAVRDANAIINRAEKAERERDEYKLAAEAEAHARDEAARERDAALAEAKALRERLEGLREELLDSDAEGWREEDFPRIASLLSSPAPEKGTEEATR